ncbi:AraC family transcriptional regulator [Mucilaginibacter gynuensis]|uniref:AraC family transcriptional regulator n=1 Tax=Mucilaginibacter gynuensis TaxID=1302236 RepID=A0ABP8FWR4_9SPHI
MDALSTILETTRLRSMVYDKFVVSGAWGVDITEDNNSQFWRLIKGKCIVGLPDNTLIEMQEGDLVYISHGGGHWIADSPSSLRIPAQKYVKARHDGIPVFSDKGDTTTLIGGHFTFDDQPHPFLKDLPRIIHIKQYETENQLLLGQLLRSIFSELNEEKPGTKLMLKCLAEIAFVNIIRAYLEQDKLKNGFISALNDRQISKSLKLMQDSPEIDWTLQSLASEVGMSRSVFFNRFKKLVGETPLNYLTDWRIRKAKDLLRTDKRNISEIAHSVGYLSEAAFNRVFKAKTNKTPAMYRRNEIAD